MLEVVCDCDEEAEETERNKWVFLVKSKAVGRRCVAVYIYVLCFVHDWRVAGSNLPQVGLRSIQMPQLMDVYNNYTYL